MGRRRLKRGFHHGQPCLRIASSIAALPALNEIRWSSSNAYGLSVDPPSGDELSPELGIGTNFPLGCRPDLSLWIIRWAVTRV